MEKINFEKKEIIQSTNKTINHISNKKTVTFAKKRGVADNICNWKYSTPKTIPIVVYNGSNCDYHFITCILLDFLN